MIILLLYNLHWVTQYASLYVLSSEYAKVPWFDSVLADIGDEQSLSQSLSTFSSHLKQIDVRIFTFQKQLIKFVWNKCPFFNAILSHFCIMSTIFINCFDSLQIILFSYKLLRHLTRKGTSSCWDVLNTICNLCQ